MPKGVPNKRYTPEFKVMVIETMRKEGLSCCEAARQFEMSSDTRIASWERSYLTEEVEGFRVERRVEAAKAVRQNGNRRQRKIYVEKYSGYERRMHT
ncbi:MAG: hypothetical protein RR998_05820 [Oscillospiraceae bacterium]